MAAPRTRTRTRGPSARLPLYRLMLRTQVTRARLAALAALGVVGIVVAAALGASPQVDHQLQGARFIDGFGLSLLVPVSALVLASASLGDLDEDGTLVYLWLRPVRRGRLVLAAAAASFTVTWPLVVGPLAVAAAVSGGDASLVIGTALAATVALFAYVSVFCALGLRVRRALVWGLLYVFIWEGFVATANQTAARLAVRTYARSLLADTAGVTLRHATVAAPWSWLVPVVVGLLALDYASYRLYQQDVA